MTDTFSWIFEKINSYFKIVKFIILNRIYKFDPAKLVIYYERDGLSYKLCIPIKMNVLKARLPDEVYDENGKDVTENIIEFMGVNHDFHGIKTTPKLLGYKKLSFLFKLHELVEFEFEKNQEIKF